MSKIFENVKKIKASIAEAAEKSGRRPEDIILTQPTENTLCGTVTSVIFKGVHFEMDVMANGYKWLVHSTKMEQIGTEVGIYIEPENIQIMHKPRSKDEEAVGIDE